MDLDLDDAARKGNLDRVRLHVEQGADKNKSNSAGNNPLYVASANGHLDVVQYLVEQGASLDETNTWGGTPLMAASAYGFPEVTRYLLEQGADRDKAGEHGMTPLHCAVCYCFRKPASFLEIAMLLMRYGADLNARDDDGRLPIDYADTEEMKQAIRDEPRRRMEEAPGKRATEQDRHPNAVTSASSQQEKVEEEQSNKRPRVDEGAVVGVETKVAEEDEDSEPSSDEDDN